MKAKKYFFSRFVSSPEEVLEVIEEGKSNRHVAVTSNFFSCYIFSHLPPNLHPHAHLN